MTDQDASLQTIAHGGRTYAICIRRHHRWDQTRFLTGDGDPMQLGLLAYGSGDEIRAHVHGTDERRINTMTEVLFCVEGKLRFTFYDPEAQWAQVAQCTVQAGDLLFVLAGGHGGQALEPSRLIEIKQGPFLGAGDKTYHPGS